MNTDLGREVIKQQLRDALKELNTGLSECLERKYPFLKRCREIFDVIVKAPDSADFKTTIRYLTQIPGYSKKISHPITLAEVEANLREAQYESPDDFVCDLRLMVENCYEFNGHVANVSANARRLEAIFETQFINRLGYPSDILTPSILRGLQGLLAARPNLQEELSFIVSAYEGTVDEIQVNNSLPIATKRAIVRFYEVKSKTKVQALTVERSKRAVVAPAVKKHTKALPKDTSAVEEELVFADVKLSGESAEPLEEEQGEPQEILRQNKHSIPFHYVPSPVAFDDEDEEEEEYEEDDE